MLHAMNLVADAGSTSIGWAVVNHLGETVDTFSTPPFNATLHNIETLKTILRSHRGKFSSRKPFNHVWFYASGLISQEQKRTVAKVFEQLLDAKETTCESDLLGAARAAADQEDAIVSILGTGSTTCLYKNGVIQNQSASLGFMLADEGSGSYLGRLLLQDYFRKKINSKVRDALRSEYVMDPGEVRAQLYDSKFPNQYLASFVPFIKSHEFDGSIQKIIRHAFDVWSRYQVIPIVGDQNLPIHVVGSVGFYFKRYIFDALQKYQLSLGQLIQDPLERLIEIHARELT